MRDYDDDENDRAVKGDNSGEFPDRDTGGITADQLRSYVERVERLEEEKADLAADIREIYSEAKGQGFDAKTMRKIVAERKQDKEARNEAWELLILYRRALGMIE